MRIVVKELRYAQEQRSFVGTYAPFSHQVRTLDLIRDAISHNKTICIENTSVTGSGKTLANFAATILDGIPTCGVYPTNELLLDQYSSLQRWLSSSMAVLDSQGLDEIMEIQRHMRTHAHALAFATEKAHYPAILTNPDVLYLAMYDLYGQMFSTFGTAFGKRVFQHIINDYPVIAFDEFHLYTPKQIANAAFIMGVSKELSPDRPHVFIFSSATPQPLFKHYTERLGISVEHVTSELCNEEHAHVVCEEVEITFLPANLLQWQGKQAIDDHIDAICSWADSVQARGIFILDSVYEAKQIAQTLRETYSSEQVGEVHGYMHKEERGGALLKRFTIGTTTIDVGVDFDEKKPKEFLVCEARSPAQALQRIGRLGRRGRNATDIPVPNKAWVFVPDYVYQYLQQRYGETKKVERSQLASMLNEAYLQTETFLPYTYKYSPLEGVSAYTRILKQYQLDQIDKNEQKLKRIITTLYAQKEPQSSEQAEQQFEKYRKSYCAIWKKYGTAIPNSKRFYLSDLESFRGGFDTDFTVAIYDELDRQQGIIPIKTYSLPFVLRRTQCREITEEQFTTLVKNNHPMEAEAWLKSFPSKYILGYMHVTDLLEETRAIYFEMLRPDAGIPFHKVTPLKGLSIIGDDIQLRSGPESITQRLKKRMLNCWISDRKPMQLNASLRLPPLFIIHTLHALDAGGRCKNPWSIALGIDAFFLESIRVPQLKTKQRNGSAFFI